MKLSVKCRWILAAHTTGLRLRIYSRDADARESNAGTKCVTCGNSIVIWLTQNALAAGFERLTRGIP